jgi:hypothetical protein
MIKFVNFESPDSLPSLDICFDYPSVSVNKAKEFIKCGVKVEYYEFTDGWNKNCTEFEEPVKMDIKFISYSKTNFCSCFTYDTKNLRIQTLLSKSSPFMKISFPINSDTNKLSMFLILIDNFSRRLHQHIVLNDRHTF